MVTYTQGIFPYQCLLKHKSAYNSTLLWYLNGYGISAASQLILLLREKCQILRCRRGNSINITDACQQLRKITFTF